MLGDATKCVICGRALSPEARRPVTIAGGIAVLACEKHEMLAQASVVAAKEAGLKLWEWKGPKVAGWFGKLRDRIRGVRP